MAGKAIAASKCRVVFLLNLKKWFDRMKPPQEIVEGDSDRQT